MRVSRNPSPFDRPNQWFDPVDPRHVGRVESVDAAGIATVRWTDTGFLSTTPLGSLQRALPKWVAGVGHVPVTPH